MKRMKLLIIDDEKDLCDLIQLILKEDHYQIDCAFTLKDAIRKWNKQHPFVVLLDNNLPDGFGLDMIERHQSLLENSSVIMITADALPATRERAEAAGIKYFMQKPFSLKTIRDLVHQIA
jgi:two-component system, OmpR family, response regulator